MQKKPKEKELLMLKRQKKREFALKMNQRFRKQLVKKEKLNKNRREFALKTLGLQKKNNQDYLKWQDYKGKKTIDSDEKNKLVLIKLKKIG